MRHLTLLMLTLCASALISCATDPQDTLTTSEVIREDRPVNSLGGKADDGGRRVALFLTSHGDVDEYEEIEPYIRSAFLKNVGVPLPKVLRELLEDPAYWLAKDLVEGQYELIGATRYRENAQRQIKAIEEALEARGLIADVYIGYNFMPEFIEQATERMARDGVTDVIVFNKGAQYSLATLGESITEMEHALERLPEWDVRITAVRQFSDDPRFVKLLADAIKRDAERYFPEVPPQDVCLLVASHGLPIRLIDMGDPAVDQMKDTVAKLRDLLPEYPLYHGFLNDDFFPGAAWVEPNAIDLSHELRSVSCPAVLMDARLSFTTHHRATLYDLDIEAREILEEPDTLADGVTLHPLYTPAQVVLAPQWDDDPGFAELIVDLTEEALRGEGDLIQVKAPAQAQ